MKRSKDPPRGKKATPKPPKETATTETATPLNTQEVVVAETQVQQNPGI